MSTFNIKRKLSKIAVTLGIFVAAFCVLTFGVNDVKAAYVTNATITEIYDEEGGNYNVYIPKVVPKNGALKAGNTLACEESYWNVDCNTRTAINTKSFTFFVMVPHAYDTGNNEQVWDSSITYFQYAVVYAGDSPVNPFWSENAGHLDSTLYPLGVPQDGSGWFNMSVAGNGGMQVSYSSAYGAIDAEGDYMIYIRYRLQGSDEVAVAEGSFGYYTNLTNLNATTIARAVSGATNKGYNLTATFTSAVNNDPDIERIAWMEGTKSVSDFTSDFTSDFLYTSDPDYTTFNPTKTTSSFAISKNVTYTFYIQDRAGNRVVKTHTVDNIFASVSVTVNGNLNQNVGSTVIYVDDNRTVVATASGNTAYYGLANVVLTAVVKDSSGNSAAKSYISWTISTTSKGKTNSLTGLNGEYDYTWTKSAGVYGKWVITAKAGSLDIGSKTITVVPILTVTPTTNKASYVYGELPTIDYTYSGWAKASTGSANDDSTIVVNKNNTYNWATMKNKGSHSFAATGFSTTYDEYVFDYKTVSYSITQKALTVTYKGGSKTYDGGYYNPNATSWADITSKYTVSGLEYGETLATLTTEYTNQQIKDVKAGNYTIVSKTLTINTASVHPTTSVDANNAHLDNYAITQNSGTYIIYPIKVHAVFNTKTLEYKQAQFESSIFTTPSNYTITYKDNSDAAVSMPTGESISAFAYKIGYGSPKPEPEDYTNDFRPETVGTYYVQARALTISGGSATNYSLTSADGEFIISKKILTVKFNNDSTSYDGTSYTDDLAALDNYTFNVTTTQLDEWKRKNDAAVVFKIKFACHTNVKGTCNPITTATAPTANDLKYAGVYTIIPVSVSNVPDSISTNYDLNINATNGTFTINRISLSIAYRAASKTYDGVSVSFGTQNLYTFTGLVSADPQSGVTKVTYTIDGSSTTQSVVNAGTYLIAPVDAEFTARDSYTISGNTSANYVINKRSATIEYIVKPAVTYNNQVYTLSSVDLYEISNFVSGQEPTLIDYEVKNSAGSAVSKVVDVGVYTITPLASSTFGTGFSHSNYDIDYVGGLFTINKRTITLTVTDKELLFKNSTYTFSDPSLYTIGGDGMAANEEIDTVAYSVKNKAGTQTATPLNVGEYNVIPSSFTVKGTPNGSAGFANYNLTGNTTLIEIVTVKIDIATCTATPLEKVYDGTTSLPRGFKMTCSGQDGNVASVDVTPGSGSGYDVADVSAKTITILAATLGNSNFEWKNNVATRTYNATIAARPINLSDMTAKSNTSFKKQYDAKTTAPLNVYYLDYSAVSPDLEDDYGIVGTDDLGLTFAANYESANVCKTVVPTNCTKTSVIKVTGAKITNSNYSLVGTSRDDDVGEITPKAATITVNDIADITYGQVATITFSYSGFVDNQNATAFEGLTSSYKNTEDKDVHRNVVASGHTIYPVYTYVKYGNYTVTDEPGTVMVTPFNISITYSQNGKDIYDAKSRNKATLFEAASNYIVDPETLPYSERLDGVLTYDLKYKEIGQGDDKYVAATDVMKAGIYKVTVSTFKIAGGNALASNYKLNTTSGTHQIDPITLIITFNSEYAGSTVPYADKNYDTDLNDKKFYTTNLLLETEKTAWNNASLSITYSAVRYIGEAAQTDRYVRNYGVYKITPTGINGTVPADIYNNYNVANMTTDHYKVGNFTINKVDVTVSFNSGQTSVYDGKSKDFTDYSATNYTVATMVGNDLASLTKVSYDVVYPSGKTKIKDAGTYKISPKDVTITADSTYGDIKQNYAFTYTKETSYVISPLAITMETVTNKFFTIGGSKERVFDDTTKADNLTITYIPQITNEDGVEENATYIGLSFSKAYNKKNVSEATSIIVSNINVTDANYTISPTSLTFTGCKLTPITNAKIITLLNGVQTTNTYTYGTEAVVTFLYEGFYSDGKVLATNSTTDQTKAAAQVTGLVHEYYPSTTTALRNVGTHPVVGKSASNTYGNYTFASANYVKADVVVEAMDVTITYKGNESIYNAAAVSTDFFTKPEYYTIVGEDPFTTNNVLPYSESVSAISNYKINNVEKGTVLSVGKYTVAATAITIAGGNALASNYNVVAVTNENTIYEVTKQPIVFKFDDDKYAYKAGEYDLSDIDLYTLTNMSDMPSSDQEKIWDLASGGATVEYTVSRKVGDTSKPDTDVINYGVYTITITNINNLDQDIIDNYKITYTTGTLTITQHTVTVTFVTANKIYDGVAVNLSNPNLYTIKVGETANAAGVVSLIGADKLSSIAYTPTTEIKRANTYPITATGMTVSSLYESANYIFKAGTAVNYVINQRELVLADFNITNDLIKTYDGNTSTDVTLAPNAKSGDKGLISGDNAQFTYDIAYESKNALGTGNSVIKVTNAAVANTDYKISNKTRDLTGATINKATLDLSKQNIYSKDFDNNTTMFATEDVEVTTGINSGSGIETLYISWSDITGAFADVKYGENKVVTISALTLEDGNNGGLASNYEFVAMSKALATINGITYDISGTTCSINVNYKTYDGNTNAMGIGFKITCSGAKYHVDDFELSYTSATFESKDAKGIKATNNITAAGFDFVNATYKNDYGFKLSALTRSFAGYINPLTLDIADFTESAASTFTKVYDGNTNSNVVLTPTGFVGTDDVKYTQTAKYDNANAGSNKDITISGTLANYNYCFSNSTGETPVYTDQIVLKGTITQKGLTIRVMLDTKDINTDVPLNELTVEYGTAIVVSYDYIDGFITGEDVSALDISKLTNTYNASTMKNVNTSTGYTVSASGATAVNYSISYQSAKLKITPFLVTLTPLARTIHYDLSTTVDMKTVGTAYSLDRTLPYSEKLAGELETENFDKFLYNSTCKRHVGTYLVLQGGITNTNNTNYTITYSSEEVYLTVNDTIKPIINNVTVVDSKGGTYTEGTTATSGLKFTVDASDEAFTLDANAYNLKVTLTICAGNDKTCAEVITAEKTFATIATTKDADGINTFTANDTARNGTFTYVFKVYDSQSNVVATPSYVLVRYLAPEFDKITESATQQNVAFTITGYDSFLNGRTASWKYFFSRTITEPTEKDFGYHGVELSDKSGSSYTEFGVSSGTLRASAKTPLGLKGNYKMLLELKIDEETIYYTQPEAFTIYIATQASQAMYLSSSYSLGNGSTYDGVITDNGNTLAVINSGNNGPTLMSYGNDNGQMVTKFDDLGNIIWSIDFGAYGIHADKVIDDGEQTIVLGSAKVVNLAQLGEKHNFNDREVVIVRIGENGQIIGFDFVEHAGADKGVAIAVHGNKYVIVVDTEDGVLVNMYDDGNLVWSREIAGEFDINDIDFDEEVVALVGEANTPEYYVDGKRYIVANRGNGDALIITFDFDGILKQIRTLGSSLHEEYVQVSVFGSYIYVLGNTEATMLYNSYGASLISTAKDGYEGFVALYKKRDVKIYRATFIGGDGDEIHTSMNVNEHGFTVVGTTTSKEELKVSGVSGNYITLPDYVGTLTLVYEYDTNMLLNSIGYFQGTDISISDIGYDLDGKLMLMSTGSSLSLMVERKFDLEDIVLSVKGKKGYVSIVGDHSEIVVTKDGNVIGNSNEFIVDSNGIYSVTVTDNYGRMVTKSIDVTSFIDGSAAVKTSQNSTIYSLILVSGVIVLGYCLSVIIASKKNKKEEV